MLSEGYVTVGAGRMSLRPIQLAFGVGDALRKAREMRGWTIEEVAKRAKVDKNTVSRAEHGRARREAEEKIARALEVPFDAILALVAHRPDADQIEEARVQITRAVEAIERIAPARGDPPLERRALVKFGGLCRPVFTYA